VECVLLRHGLTLGGFFVAAHGTYFVHRAIDRLWVVAIAPFQDVFEKLRHLESSWAQRYSISCRKKRGTSPWFALFLIVRFFLLPENLGLNRHPRSVPLLRWNNLDR